jgi:hypothetical protein
MAGITKILPFFKFFIILQDSYINSGANRSPTGAPALDVGQRQYREPAQIIETGTFIIKTARLRGTLG